MHSISFDKGKKAMMANLSGNIGVDQANQMLSDFKKVTAGINTREYILIINPENITASIFVLPILQSFLQLVAQLCFSKIYLVNSDKYAGIIKQSLNSYGIANSVAYVNNMGEALNR